MNLQTTPFRYSIITLLSLLLVLLTLTVGCAGSGEQRKGSSGEETGQPSGQDGNDTWGEQPDDWGDDENPGQAGGSVGKNQRGLPDLNYDTRTASPQFQPAEGAGQIPAVDAAIERIVVDTNHPDATDAGTGTLDVPFKSIERGLQKIKQLAGPDNFIHLRIHEGIYREQLKLSVDPDSRSRILIEGVGDVVVTGSEIYTDWTSIGNGRFEHPWPHDWGLVTETDEWKKRNEWMKDKHRDWIERSGTLFKRREMLLVDGSVMTQVLGPGQVKDGCYFVDEPGDRLILDLPAGVEVDDALIEVGERWQTLHLSRCPNVTLRNLTFTGAATMVEQRSVWLRGCDNLLVENCKFVTNNYRGLGLYGSDHVTLRNCVASNNGAQGIDLAHVDNLLIENCVTNDNNWRGAWGKTHAWAIAGIKILNTANVIVRNHEALNNKTFGVWFDHDNLHVLLENSVMNGNSMDGLFLEATRGPILVRNCTLEHNTLGGVRIANAERITLENNRIAGNRKTQIYLRGFGRMVDTRVSGLEEKMQYRDITFVRNTIVAETADQLLFWTNLSKDQMKPFISSVHSDHNTWVHPAPDASIKLTGAKKLYGFDVWQETIEGPNSEILAEQ